MDHMDIVMFVVVITLLGMVTGLVTEVMKTKKVTSIEVISWTLMTTCLLASIAGWLEAVEAYSIGDFRKAIGIGALTSWFSLILFLGIVYYWRKGSFKARPQKNHNCA